MRARRAAGRPDSLHLTPLRFCTVVMPPSRDTRYKISGDANFRNFHLYVIGAACHIVDSQVAVAALKGGGGGVGWW